MYNDKYKILAIFFLRVKRNVHNRLQVFVTPWCYWLPQPSRGVYFHCYLRTYLISGHMANIFTNKNILMPR